MKTHAFPLQLAKEAILLGKYTEAINILKPLSNSQSNLDAQFLHAFLHFFDDDLNRLDAIDLLREAADKGHKEANYVLAACPNLTPGYTFELPQNNEQLQYLQKAADSGSNAAMTDLAECYLIGVLVAENCAQAGDLLDSIDFKAPVYPKTYLLLAKSKLEQHNLTEAVKLLRASTYHFIDRYVAIVAELDLQTIEKLQNDEPTKDFQRDIEAFEEMLTQLSEKSRPQWESYLHHYCQSTFEYDLRDANFDAFCDFIFDHHPQSWRNRDKFRWSQHAKVMFHANEIVRFYTELFQNPGFLQERYSDEQIIQGFDMNGMRGSAHWTIGCVMWHESTTVEEAEACIHAMYDLFVHLFSKAVFIEVGFMWWDIGYGACGHSSLKNMLREATEEEKHRLRQATFDTQVRVLKLKGYENQKAAIHGLGHSSHPDKEKVLRNYLDENPDLPAWLRDYAIGAIEGTLA